MSSLHCLSRKVRGRRPAAIFVFVLGLIIIIKLLLMALKSILQTAVLCLVLQTTSLRTHAQGRSDLLRDPVNYYTTTELACSDGYHVQEHKFVTRDGYVLTVHRIPNGKRRPKVPRSKNHYHKTHLHHHPDFHACIRESLKETAVGMPVLFVHGILMASDGWLLQGPGSDLAYLMADKGYDVWLANVRGNCYTREHVALSPSDPRFWDFSFHENAVIDIPETIDYILEETKQEKLGYVGMSMGTTIFFAMTSMLPQYNDKILGFVALAPVAFTKQKYMDHRRRTMFDFLARLLKELQRRGNIHELFPRTTKSADLGKIYCSKGSQLQDFCYDLISPITGYHSKLVLRNKFHLYLTHSPTGTSLKTLLHYLQNIERSSFKLFDYGKEENFRLYGTPTPPDYPLWNITAPVALYYTKHDFFYDTKDIDDLRQMLPNVIDVDVKEKFNHVDYIWSFNAKDILYPRALRLFDDLTARFQQRWRKKSAGR